MATICFFLAGAGTTIRVVVLGSEEDRWKALTRIYRVWFIRRDIDFRRQQVPNLKVRRKARATTNRGENVYRHENRSTLITV